MMSTEHTQGRLIVKGGYSIYADGDKTPVADTCMTNSMPENDEGNARRLVACWNACEGLPTEKLEISPIFDVAMEAKRHLESVEKQRDELLKALKMVSRTLDEHEKGLMGNQFTYEYKEWSLAVRAAIAKAEGGAA